MYACQWHFDTSFGKQKEVLDIMKRYLLVANTSALDALTDLVVHFARDLLQLFYHDGLFTEILQVCIYHMIRGRVAVAHNIA